MFVPAITLQKQLEQIFIAWEMSLETIQPTVQIMVETDLRGIDSHGIAMLPLYAELRTQGKIVMQPNIKIVRENNVTALIDAGGGLGHAPSVMALELAIKKGKKNGLAAVAVRGSNHYGAAGAYSLIAARSDLIGISMTNAGSRAIVPTRSKTPTFGTNPIAFSAPSHHNEPLVLDMATSTVAIGKVKLAAYDNRPMPTGWIVNDEGKTIVDPHQAFDGTGRLKEKYGVTPLGGLDTLSSHKGYGLAVMVEVLCSMLTGSPFIGTLKDKSNHETGHFFIVIDPKKFRDFADFTNDLDDMASHLRKLEPTNPEEPVLVPGDPENITKTERLETGIPIPKTLATTITDICANCGADYLFSEF